MPRYVAFLRGVSPVNASMPALKHCFEGAGFANVCTVLSSGNLVFDARAASDASLARKAEAAMQAALGRSFHAIVRPVESLRALLAADPYAAFAPPAHAKRVVSFLRGPVPAAVVLPISSDGAKILCATGREIFTAYVPGDQGPVFMKLIEQAFGREVTTRTWETIRRCAAA